VAAQRVAAQRVAAQRVEVQRVEVQQAAVQQVAVQPWSDSIPLATSLSEAGPTGSGPAFSTATRTSMSS
jgi:hypothetical protein